jgi:hypothetical protein
MKNVLLLAGLVGITVAGKAQLQAKEVCSFSVDILNGTVNGARPDFTPGQIKKMVPCFTSEEMESKDAKCGGAIYYKDRDMVFYTARDYVELGPNFKGKLSIPLMGAKRNSLFKWLGLPKVKDTNWEAFQTQYGCLVLYYNPAGIVKKIQFSTYGTEALNLCQ